VKSTSITPPPDVIGYFLAVVERFFNDKTELFVASVTAVIVPV
jgi:hypothetical protein